MVVLEIVETPRMFMDVVVSRRAFIDVTMAIIRTRSRVALSDWVEPYNYIGTAYIGTAETDPLWTITRIEIAADGTTTETVATDVPWSERLTATYS